MELVNPSDRVIVVAGKNWHEGVVGIVASRLVTHFQKPAIVLSIHNGIAKGSGRSIGNVDLYSLIKSQEALLAKFGGHKMAAGLSLEYENVDPFRQGINDVARSIPPEDFIPHSDVVGELEHEMINFQLLELLERFEPYGEGNPRPKFLIREADVVNVRLFGSDQSHSRIELRPKALSPKTMELIAFRRTLEYPENKKISCSYTVNKNEWNGRVSIQLMVERVF
jgi:single-stranded-DNA-specific exonuclease